MCCKLPWWKSSEERCRPKWVTLQLQMMMMMTKKKSGSSLPRSLADSGTIEEMQFVIVVVVGQPTVTPLEINTPATPCLDS